MRRLVILRDVAWDAGRTVVRAWAGAVIPNEGDLAARGAELGARLGGVALQALGLPAGAVGSYGKAAIVGVGGRIADGEQLLHPKLGAPLRELLGRGRAIIPSTIKLGGPGTRIDVPLHGVDDEWDFGHVGAVEAGAPEGPRPDEIFVVVALGGVEQASEG